MANASKTRTTKEKRPTIQRYELRETLVPKLDERFNREYLQWAWERPTMESMGEEATNARGMTRLVEGVFRFGEFEALITLKMLMVQVGEGEVKMTVLDHMSRVR